MPKPFDRSEGRVLFEAAVSAYSAARPDYPERVFELLVQRCGLGPGARALDIGAGPGQATIRLLDAGAHVLAVEPSPTLAAELQTNAASNRLDVVIATFEEVELPYASFDLVTAATAFHWLDPQRSLERIIRVLRPGGWLALWWNVFGDPAEPDAFHQATHSLLSSLSPSPSEPRARRPFALDMRTRRRELAKHGFSDVRIEIMRWDLVLSAQETRRLYATYSNIARLVEERRTAILDEIERIARDRFANRVVRRMVTPLYTARRPA